MEMLEDAALFKKAEGEAEFGRGDLLLVESGTSSFGVWEFPEVGVDDVGVDGRGKARGDRTRRTRAQATSWPTVPCPPGISAPAAPGLTPNYPDKPRLPPSRKPTTSRVFCTKRFRNLLPQMTGSCPFAPGLCQTASAQNSRSGKVSPCFGAHSCACASLLQPARRLFLK
jgi:hypothetical protein